jgi:hypothetical protein
MGCLFVKPNSEKEKIQTEPEGKKPVDKKPAKQQSFSELYSLGSRLGSGSFSVVKQGVRMYCQLCWFMCLMRDIFVFA